MKVILRNSSLVFEAQRTPTEAYVTLAKGMVTEGTKVVTKPTQYPAQAGALILNNGNLVKAKWNTELSRDVERRLFVSEDYDGTDGNFTLTSRLKTTDELNIPSTAVAVIIAIYYGSKGLYSANIEEYIGDLGLDEIASVVSFGD